MKIGELLFEMYNRNASDLILKVESPPLFRIFGDLIPHNSRPLTEEDSRGLFMRSPRESSSVRGRELWGMRSPKIRKRGGLSTLRMRSDAFRLYISKSNSPIFIVSFQTTDYTPPEADHKIN